MAPPPRSEATVMLDDARSRRSGDDGAAAMPAPQPAAVVDVARARATSRRAACRGDVGTGKRWSTAAAGGAGGKPGACHV